MTSKKKILVVEDNELNRELLAEILSPQYTVLQANNGQEALDILRQHKNNISVIVLDIIMPVMDGFTFLDRKKEDAALEPIPVIVLTQGSSEADELAALAHGATEFVPKPYSPQIILHRVASIIKLRESCAMVNLFQYDRMTGLYSREFFFEQVRKLLAENPDQNYSIICSNIENFKLFNDVFGVAAGDKLLKDIAGRLRNMVGETGICGRYGGDRFLILMEWEQALQARSRMEHISNDIYDCHMKNVYTKWGIYEIHDRTLPVEHMCDRAMLAADTIKGQYNHYCNVYDDALRSKLLRERSITESMESALREGQFVVYLQPKYDLHSNSLVGAEALVRWQHPEWGFISPGEFIPLFEKNGFITEMDQYIWEQACILLRDWKERGYPLLPISVNVSRADIYMAGLEDIILNLTRKYGIEPEYLHLEITESAYIEDPRQLIETVDKLRALGFVIEMDDFGSGYSSLNMLDQMKIDILKLDQTLIHSRSGKPEDPGILLFVIALARWMKLRVVAEGVETPEQLSHLREIGCDYAQGYLFARPMPAADYEHLLRDQKLEKIIPPEIF